MKILYAVHQFFPEHVTGTERFTLNVAKEMKNRGHDVEIVTYRETRLPGDKKIGDYWISRYRHEGLKVTAACRENVPRDWWFALRETDSANRLADFLFSGKRFDIAHVTHTQNVGPLVHALPSFSVPYVLTFTDFFLYCHRFLLVDNAGNLCGGPKKGDLCFKKCAVPGLSKDYVRERYSAGAGIIRSAAALVAPSKQTAAMVRREFPGQEISVIPFGVEPKPENGKNARRSSVVFGFMGMLAPHKGIEILVRAFRGIDSDDARLKIYGPVLSPQYGIKILKEMMLDPRIEFLGAYNHTDVWKLLKGIDVLCFPSTWHETFGIIVEEALAAKVPPIVSDLGAPQERVRDGVNGLIVRAGSETALRKAMRSILTSPELLKKLRKGMNGYAKLEDEADQYEKIYANVTSKPALTDRREKS